MWWWATVAMGDPIAAEEALDLGPPLMHQVDGAQGVLRLEWKREDGSMDTHEIAVAAVRDVRQVPDADGPHLLTVRTDEGDFVLERGPCVLMAAMAPKVAAALGRPLVEGPMCVDAAAESAAWLEQHTHDTTFTQVEMWDEALLADVRVTERASGAPALDVQRGLVGVRPLLGHCFTRQQASGRAGFDATARTNGSLGRVSPVSPGTGVGGVDGCIADQLDEAALPVRPTHKRRVHIEVSTP